MLILERLEKLGSRTNKVSAKPMQIAVVQPGQSRRPPKRQPGEKRKHVRTKPQLLTRAELDGRSNAAKFYDQLIIDIENDLGGRDNISTIEHGLIEAYAGAKVWLDNINTRLALGQQIDFSEHASAISALVKTASRLGLSRRSKNVTPTLSEYIDSLKREEVNAEQQSEAAE